LDGFTRDDLKSNVRGRAGILPSGERGNPGHCGRELHLRDLAERLDARAQSRGAMAASRTVYGGVSEARHSRHSLHLSGEHVLGGLSGAASGVTEVD
jgi:hypothetical protein